MKALELLVVLVIVAVSLWLGYVFGYNWSSEASKSVDSPLTATVIVCEDGWHYVAVHDEHYVRVRRGGVIYIYERGEGFNEPVVIIDKPACTIDWNRESAEVPKPSAPTAPPSARLL